MGSRSSDASRPSTPCCLNLAKEQAQIQFEHMVSSPPLFALSEQSGGGTRLLVRERCRYTRG